MSWRQREQAITRLLSETAEQAPTGGDLTPRLHERLAALPAHAAPRSAQERAQPAILTLFPRRPAFRWAVATVAVALIVGVVFSTFAFAHRPATRSVEVSGSQMLVLHDAAWINRSVTLRHITIQVQQGYADASRTALFIRLTSSTQTGGVSPYPGVMYVEDAQGNMYPGGSSATEGDYTLITFAPFAQAELSSQQTLTLVITQLIIPRPPVTFINGPWKVSFTIQPRVGRSVTLSALPQTHDGTTMQPLRLDLAPGGARLLVRVSGLKANTSRFALSFFAIHEYKLIGCPSGTDICESDGGGSGTGPAMSLRGADGQTLAPGWVVVTSDTTPDIPLRADNSNQVVGSAGSAVLEFLFYSPLHATHGATHVSIAQLEEDPTDGVTNGPSHLVNGPWTFTLSL